MVGFPSHGHISKVTFVREKVVSAKNHFSGAGALTRNSGTVWTIAKWTAPLHAAKCALRDGVNISVCENKSKRSVFSDPVTYYCKAFSCSISNLHAGT